ncbi:MAG: polysaccharide biosynthesis protein [Rhodospirillaceae bacterium]|nr:polysaccharide biosynthesis protein [Rhodospirillaceae bacterium]MBT5242939.1 polysaccharide biosynthesis protein [Rhodospirillaceae bacterium]MBT5563163.1 polysaccharide biosynthesis protein [Rhodospirillaceae bacterium]MBT6243478.1 polysaccharide biosynthesis protein [Rhodospirillaceae bacterium]
MPVRIPHRGYLVYAHDIIMTVISFYASIYLRLGERFDTFFTTETLLLAGGLFGLIAAGVYMYLNLYRGVWRYASINDLFAITRAVTLVILIFLLAMFLWSRLHNLPRSYLAINWFVLMALLGGPRFLYRLSKDRRLDLRLEDVGAPRIPVLLVGAGDATEEFIRSIGRTADANYRIVGILSESEGRVGRNIHGVSVLGTLDNITDVIAALDKRGEQPQRLILSKEDLDGAKVRSLLDAATEAGMTLARLPRLTDFKSGPVDATEMRPVAIEDLLGRPQHPLDRDAMASLIKDKRVLITGSGGSIGSELVRQVSDLEPRELTLVDHSEFNLYTIDMETGERHPNLERRAVITDVRDAEAIRRLFEATKPELVFHAAALKHVPLVEANPCEGVLTNVIGTANVADACEAADVDTMVMISTDKAVNPTNVMGASKRIAERYCQGLDLKRGKNAGTRFVTVRFGNVLGSTGSVVPLFQKQLAVGGPLTVTDAQMKRYFMTVGEAVELILQASAMEDGEHLHDGKIFVLDMGEPVLIMDLARQMIRLAGLVPDEDIDIKITGLRPGEKLFEEMFHGGEPLVETGQSGILLAAPRAADAAMIALAIENLTAAARDNDTTRVMTLIGDLVPEYQSAPTDP